jgi:hypothetical protein
MTTEVVAKLERGRPRKYPWDEWLGRPETVLVRGVHYHCSQSTMTQNIRCAASHRKVRVRLVDTGTEIWIRVSNEA